MAVCGRMRWGWDVMGWDGMGVSRDVATICHRGENQRWDGSRRPTGGRRKQKQPCGEQKTGTHTTPMDTMDGDACWWWK